MGGVRACVCVCVCVYVCVYVCVCVCVCVQVVCGGVGEVVAYACVHKHSMPTQTNVLLTSPLLLPHYYFPIITSLLLLPHNFLLLTDLTGKQSSPSPSHLQRGDIIISMNDKDLVNKTHSEAVEVIKSLAGASFVRMSMILGEESTDKIPPPEWKEWVTQAQLKSSKPR